MPVENLISQEYLREFLLRDFDFHNLSSNYSTHNFHSFPAKFPPQLPRSFISEFTKKGETILDPMVGSGTTILEACLLGRKSIGIDLDPLALLISKVKTTNIEINALIKEFKEVQQIAQAKLSNKSELTHEMESFFDKETKEFINNWFLLPTQYELFALIQAINTVENEDFRNFFKVAFSSTIITKSGGVSLALDLGHTRPHLAKKAISPDGTIIFGNTDTSTPRYLEKIIRPAFREFEKRCENNFKSLLPPSANFENPSIQFGNSQSMPIESNTIDLIVTSPPYASNAIDYMRAHKFSLVWMGYTISDLSQRRKNYIGAEATDGYDLLNLPDYPELIINRVALKDIKRGKVLRRYYSEMYHVLTEFYRVLKPGNLAVLVVGNTILKGVDTETAFCLSEIGKSLGFAIPAIGVRRLDRNKRMMPAGNFHVEGSQIQQRMHEEYILGFLK